MTLNKERLFLYNNTEVRKMVQDRGNIKWTTLMLPEHAELLKELWEEDKKIQKPVLDPQEIEYMNYQLAEACQHQLSIILTVYHHGKELDYPGIIKKIDKEKKCIIMQAEFSGEISIPFDSIIRMNIS